MLDIGSYGSIINSYFVGGGFSYSKVYFKGNGIIGYDSKIDTLVIEAGYNLDIYPTNAKLTIKDTLIVNGSNCSKFTSFSVYDYMQLIRPNHKINIALRHILVCSWSYSPNLFLTTTHFSNRQ